MITPSAIYWLTRLDEIISMVHGLIELATVISAIAIFIWGTLAVLRVFYRKDDEFFIGMDDSQFEAFKQSMHKRTCRILRGGIIVALVALTLRMAVAFIPTTKETAAIIVIPKIANSESVQQLGHGIIDLANQWLEELAPKKEEK